MYWDVFSFILSSNHWLVMDFRLTTLLGKYKCELNMVKGCDK